jgi:hypothetical protein
MKSKDVPQDDANMMQGKFREPVYSVDEKGNYTTVKSVGWDAKNEVMQDAWDNVNDRIEKARQNVIKGKSSPIAYYIEKNIMDVGIVASYMRIWKWRVRRHLKPSVFKNLSDEMIDKYCEVFGVKREVFLNADLRNTEEKQNINDNN